jgi:DNA polymerase III alpha subunit
VVATNDVRFLDAADFDAHEARVCIHQGHTLSDPRRPRDYSEEQYLKSAADMEALFADLPEALENSVEIARRCSLELTLGRTFLPDFPVPEGETPAVTCGSSRPRRSRTPAGPAADGPGRTPPRTTRPGCSANSTSSATWASRATS